MIKGTEDGAQMTETERTLATALLLYRTRFPNDDGCGSRRDDHNDKACPQCIEAHKLYVAEIARRYDVMEKGFALAKDLLK